MLRAQIAGAKGGGGGTSGGKGGKSGGPHGSGASPHLNNNSLHAHLICCPPCWQVAGERPLQVEQLPVGVLNWEARTRMLPPSPTVVATLSRCLKVSHLRVAKSAGRHEKKLMALANMAATTPPITHQAHTRGGMSKDEGSPMGFGLYIGGKVYCSLHTLPSCLTTAGRLGVGSIGYYGCHEVRILAMSRMLAR